MTAQREFGMAVRAERLRRGWTQADLAGRLAAAGISLHQSAVAKIELQDAHRPRVITLDEAVALADLLDLPLGRPQGREARAVAAAVRSAKAEMADSLRTMLDNLDVE